MSKNNKNIFSKMLNSFKVVLGIVTILFNIALFISAVVYLNAYSTFALWLVNAISLVLVLKIIYNYDKSSYKISWIVFLTFVPTSAILFYFLFSKHRPSRQLRRKIDVINNDTLRYTIQNHDILDEITDLDVKQQATLINNKGGYPIQHNTKVKYLHIGEVYFEELMIQLKKAEKFIFMEYFIVSESKIHREVMEILKEKANNGVKVYYMYDCAGSISTLPKNFHEECEANNINLLGFNSDFVHLYTYASFRDHRKLTVIDGNVGFTGGVNIADEYANDLLRFGHWKDMGVMLDGEGVWNLSLIFLKAWNQSSDVQLDYEDFRPTVSHDSGAYVCPFDDGPITRDDPAENNYIRMIASAKKYVYLSTPYLILSNDLVTAFKLAVDSGVDVRVLTPHIPDKKIIFEVTRAYYEDLLSVGVKVFEYTPGFVHGKIMVSDDKVATVGSINFDYRSLVWNYECAAWVYDKDFAISVKDDYLNTLSRSQEWTMENYQNIPLIHKLFRAFLKLLSPLM